MRELSMKKLTPTTWASSGIFGTEDFTGFPEVMTITTIRKLLGYLAANLVPSLATGDSIRKGRWQKTRAAYPACTRSWANQLSTERKEKIISPIPRGGPRISSSASLSWRPFGKYLLFLENYKNTKLENSYCKTNFNFSTTWNKHYTVVSHINS